MGNMSYCQFENTVTDFEQCVEAIGNCESLADFSKSERRAAERMFQLAENYIEWYEQAKCETPEDE